VSEPDPIGAKSILDAQGTSVSESVLSADAMSEILQHTLNGIAYCKMLYQDGKPCDWVYLYTNPAFRYQTGLMAAEGKRVTEIIPDIKRADPQLFEVYSRVAQGGNAEQFEVYVEALHQWFSVQVFCPKPEHFVAIFDVVTKRKQVEAALMQEKDLLRGLIDSIPDLAFIKDERGVYLECNKASEQLVGRSRNEQIGKTDFDFFDHRTAEIIRDQDRQVIRGGAGIRLEEWVTYPDGRRVLLETSKTPLYGSGGDIRGLVGLCRDITERKQLEEQVRQLAFCDPLTQLPNRRVFSDRLRHAMATSKRSGYYGALMFLDLDHFKHMNDAHGHDVGDLLLIEFADRLVSCVREVDTVARIGGDEFVVIVSEIDRDLIVSKSQTGAIAEKVRATLLQPYQLMVTRKGQATNTMEYNCTVSIGVAMFVNDEATYDEILKCADTAMYRAKEAGRNSIWFYDRKN
jgi:diguanylate cyclase (GGDEF)-like protein/PAS domain S-box-containing protein